MSVFLGTMDIIKRRTIHLRPPHPTVPVVGDSDKACVRNVTTVAKKLEEENINGLLKLEGWSQKED
jgi:hypothetical protein